MTKIARKSCTANGVPRGIMDFERCCEMCFCLCFRGLCTQRRQDLLSHGPFNTQIALIFFSPNFSHNGGAPLKLCFQCQHRYGAEARNPFSRLVVQERKTALSCAWWCRSAKPPNVLLGGSAFFWTTILSCHTLVDARKCKTVN